ncbi:hypothetical protein FBD94_09815 [Pedobacter hiemivivus]|uniref:Uncharacterized protein n=1 Tax=Pedobacter hiemivivus TaxID=2530454 RepID=A0A4U1GHS7_9SPHI|nr:hypothetical protein [Pedobacter hiemivivus]TKC62500.1 hypothetical protein FBD94_09815 [Pedobacter hiemivivus]
MRTHTTHTLRTLIVNDMDIKKCTLNKQQINTWVETLPEITAEMYETICFFTGSIFLGKMVGRQIRQIHGECITLLDKIDKYQNLPSEMDALKSATIKCLDNVMDKLESDCSRYLEKKVQMPIIHLRRQQVRIESQTCLITAYFKNLGLGLKLNKLVLESMADLLKATRCYYYRVDYMNAFQDALIELCKKSNKSDFEGRLIDLLIGMNFNSGTFIKYYQQVMMDELAVRITEEEQMSFLNHLERSFARDSYRKSALSYDIDRKRIKCLLSEFVNVELRIRAKKVAMSRPVNVQQPTGPQVNSAPVTNTGNYKIRTPLSVDALAYFIKLMIAAKAIEPGVKTELLNFIASIFQTPGVGSAGISATSFGAKYKQVVQSTAKTVRVILVRMLKVLDDEFEFG